MINLINTEEFADIIKEKGWCSGATNEQYAKLFKMVEQNASYERIALAVWFCTPEESEDNIKDEIIARFWDRGRKHDENLKKEVYVYTHPHCQSIVLFED